MREKTEGAQDKMKQFYDRGASRNNIEEGDWVLLRKQPRNNTLSPLFDGPWIVTKRIGVNVHIRNHESAASRVVHLNKCKSIPNYGEGVNDGLTWLEESTEETGIDGNDHQQDDEGPDEVELTEQDTRSSPINPPRRSTRIRRQPFWYTDDYVFT